MANITLFSQIISRLDRYSFSKIVSKKLQKYIKKSRQSKKKLTSLKRSQQKAIASLEKKHTNYQKELKKI